MQSKIQLEKFYEKDDPWGYETNKEDKKRKKIIIDTLKHNLFPNVLDIGCGQGFITEDLPSLLKYGCDLSSTAMKRLPTNVIPISLDELICGETKCGITIPRFGLVTTMGTLYKQYDYKQIVELVNKYADSLVLTCNIESWEKKLFPDNKMIYEKKFKYRQYTERLAIYDLSPTQCWEYKKQKLQYIPTSRRY
jgi:SAM-dependent methyltransferase